MKNAKALKNLNVIPMVKKEARDAVLYARIKSSNLEFLHGEMQRLGYKRLSEFMDKHIDEWREATRDRKAK